MVFCDYGERGAVMKDMNIYIDQAGYRPDGAKLAVLPFAAESFAVCDTDGNAVYGGKTLHFGFDEASGDDVYTADFSDFSECGTYRIEADGKHSPMFKIADDVYAPVCRDLLRAFYYLRCGCGLDEKYAGEYAHAPCHTEPAVEWEDHSVSKDICGGWHDAGDYGRYVTAGACALAHMLYGYKLFPKAFDGIKSNIPDSSDKMPDLLTECRVELEWIMKMQRADGGVYHKATTAHHAPFIMPEEDMAQMYLLPVSSSATADASAVLALGASVYRPFDAEFADRLSAAAQKSYEWLENNPDFLFVNPKECTTGVYGEHDDTDNRFWAAAEMFSLTGREKYCRDAEHLAEKDFPKTALGYSETGGFGALAYIFAKREGRNEKLLVSLKNGFVRRAEELKGYSDKCGYGTALLPQHYGWGSNMGVLVSGMIFVIADILCDSGRYKNYAAAQLDYILGKNALGISYVSGTGEHSINNPHFRPAFADGVDKCHEGMVSGGPNGHPCDSAAEKLIPKGTPPMKCFADDTGCFSLNEITIYWNSPAVFLAAYLNMQ